MKPLLYTGLILLLAPLPLPAARAATYRVGPGRPYATLQEVASLLGPGDVVEVDGGHTYPGGVVFTRPGTAGDPITIRGSWGGQTARPVLYGGTNTVHFETSWPYDGTGENDASHYVFEGFEVTGGTSRGIFHQAADLTVRDTVVRGCPQHGILGADGGSGSLILECVEVYNCGEGDSCHQIYAATDEVNRPGSVFRMEHCYLHDANGGNNVKSRAERNEIRYNWIEGAYYHELELIGPDPGGAPDGWTPDLAREDSDVVGNVIFSRREAYHHVIRIGGDGTGESDGRYRFVNNTIILSESNDAAVFRLFDGLESVEMHNNVLWRVGGNPADVMRELDADWATGTEVIAGSNNWIPSSAVNVPVQWRGTVPGADPGFADPGSDDFHPAAASPLIGAGNCSPEGPPGFPFPEPLFPPVRHPPPRPPGTCGSAEDRPVSGSIDLGAYERLSPPPVSGPPRDYNGDGTGEIAVFRESGGLWAVRGLTRAYFGRPGDLPVPADYAGGGTAAIAVFRPAAGLWAVRGVTRAYFGSAADLPVPGDYRGDGTVEVAVFRESSGLWAVRGVTRAYFGVAGDLPVPGDYRGAGTSAPAVFRPAAGLWAARGSTRLYFGGDSDLPVPGDYSGSGSPAPAVFRPAAGLWAARGITRVYFGISTDLPVPGGYCGDGTDLPAVFRGDAGLWAVRGVTRVYFGRFGDRPVSR